MLCECGCGSIVHARFVRGHNRRGLKNSVKHNARIGRGNRGKARSVETRVRLSISHKGLRASPETRAKLSEINRHEGNAQWKGDGAKYSAIHMWVKKNRVKTGKCSTCAHEGYTEWANISGVYLRDLTDYAEMCKRCHYEFDTWLESHLDRTVPGMLS
jgi:hypothetical protein